MKQRLSEETIVILAFIALFGLLIVGASFGTNTTISVWHVDDKNVTCFMLQGELDCIPDWQLSQPTD